MTKVDIPTRVTIPTSELGCNQYGTVISTWTNNIQVRWDDGTLGQYNIVKHQIKGEL